MWYTMCLFHDDDDAIFRVALLQALPCVIAT